MDRMGGQEKSVQGQLDKTLYTKTAFKFQQRDMVQTLPLDFHEIDGPSDNTSRHSHHAVATHLNYVGVCDYTGCWELNTHDTVEVVQ